MDPVQIHDVVDWIQSHPLHISQRCYDTRAELWFRFCQNPSLVSEYTGPLSMTMSEPIVTNGCTYIFESGPEKSNQCNVALVPGKNRCIFHDQIVFSETIRDIHDEINNDTRTISKNHQRH